MGKRPKKRRQVIADVMGLAAIAGAVLAWTAHDWVVWLGVALVLAGAATGLLVTRLGAEAHADPRPAVSGYCDPAALSVHSAQACRRLKLANASLTTRSSH